MNDKRIERTKKSPVPFFIKARCIQHVLQVNEHRLGDAYHPTHFTEKDGKNTSFFFYHRERGKIIYSSRLIDFLSRLGIDRKPDRFEYFYTSFLNPSFFSEVMDSISIFELLRAGKGFLSKLSSKELQNLKKDCYFVVLSLLDKWGQKKELEILTHYFFIHCLFAVTPPTPIKKDIKDWCLGLIKTRFGTAAVLSESAKENPTGAVFRLILDGKDIVSVVTGGSIKTLRSKAYKELLTHLLTVEGTVPVLGKSVSNNPFLKSSS